MAGRGVAGEADTGAGAFTHVTEDHSADIDCGAQVVRDALTTTVDACALGVPGAEHGFDGHIHLGARILREVHALLLGNDLLEGLNEALQVVSGQFGVALDATSCLQIVQGVGEQVTLNVENRLAEHLDQTTVGVPCEALVARDLCETLNRVVVQTDIEDGFHHARHRELCARTHRDEERVVGVTQVAFHLVFDAAKSGSHLGFQGFGNNRILEVCAARLSGNGESGGNGQSKLRHFRKVCALTSEQVLHGLVALGEVIHILDH